ncbi:hypothetical protein [Bacillus wiedmannii]|uniref:hypothetical protein n=1 Tax=Bacillus wiedmannii TaxID=1890302 RepID=UPI000BEF526F|nr:hypothetical protein [Bacillus wiedmannii]PEM08554.1 hypothetical protein CN610_20085 [Bacillus wiedmannii]
MTKEEINQIFKDVITNFAGDTVALKKAETQFHTGQTHEAMKTLLEVIVELDVVAEMGGYA